MKKMQSLQRLLSATVLLITVMLLITLSVSCRKQDAAGTGESEAPKTVDYSQHEEFSAWLYADPYDQYSDYSENPIVWYLNKKFNVTLKFEQPARGTERDAMSLMFGTGEYTDMIEMSNYNDIGSIAQLYEDGVVVDIAQYLDYMPNFKKLLETDEGFRRTSYDDAGHILSLRNISDPYELPFAGLMYRYDILNTITGGNVSFPSGEDNPKTIEDWEYMLSLFKTYFEASGMKEYAPLILPYQGYLTFGDLVNSFGGRSIFYLDGGTVKFGPLEEPFYKYLKKMREWYEKGYIYKDFASRVNDPLYLPNTALTYGGAAGAWFGLTFQVGDSMSMPQYNLFFDVRAVPSPLSTEDGVTEFSNFAINPPYENGGVGWAFTAKCKNLPKLLSVMDYLYSEEGGYLKSGLTKETGAGENKYYVDAGLQDGLYWFEDGKAVVNPKLADFSNYNAFWGMRVPGRVRPDVSKLPARMALETSNMAIWNPYPNAKYPKLPGAYGMGAARSAEEDKTYTANYVRLTDYIDSTVPKFIMGTQPLNDQTWAEFKAELRNLGIEENIRIQQAAYERWLKR